MFISLAVFLELFYIFWLLIPFLSIPYSQEIFSVQVGAFSSMKNAHNVLRELETPENKCIIQKTEGLYRVYCGEFKKRQDAITSCQAASFSCFCSLRPFMK